MTARLGKGNAITVISILFIVFFAGCAPAGSYLKWNQIDAGALMKSESGKQAYHTIRVATYGPRAEQIYGYLLYKDGIEVQSEQGIPFDRLGKKTLEEVMLDYDAVRKSKMYTSGSNLIVREIFRRDAVVGYTASDINIDVSIWDITQGDGPPVLRLVYKDLRENADADKLPSMRRMH
jgi:hypothetical protein